MLSAFSQEVFMRKAAISLFATVFSLWGVLGYGTFSPAFSTEPLPALKISDAQAGRRFNAVKGVLKEAGRGFVIVEGKRYPVPVGVRFVDEENGVLKEGSEILKSGMKVELMLEGQTVIEIKIFGLLAR
jgi:hypothetical protein